MGLQGKASFGLFNLGPHAQQVVQIGTDGNRYMVAHTVPVITGSTFRIGRIDPGGGPVANLTATQALIDLAASPLAAPSGMSVFTCVAARDRPYFYVLFYKIDTPCHFAALMYKINSIADIQAVGGKYLRCANQSGPIGAYVTTGENIPHLQVFGANVFNLGGGDKLYFISDAGFGNPSLTLETWAWELPLDEAYVSDSTPGSLNAVGTRLAAHGSDLHPLSWHSFFESGTERSFGDKASLIKSGNKIGIFRYNGLGVDPQQMYYAEITIGQNLGYTAGDPVITGSYIENKSVEFGVPYSDIGLTLDGQPATGNADYTAPSVLSETEIAMLRGNHNALASGNATDGRTVRLRRFKKVGGAWLSQGIVDITSHNSENWALAPETISAQASRDPDNPDDIDIGVCDGFRWIFGFATITATEPPTATYPDLPTTEVDTVDELPPADALIEVQRWLFRTGHIREWGEIAVDDLRLTVKRGVGDTDFEPSIWVRANRDNRSWTKWAKKGLGKKGDRTMTLTFGGFGTARDWQFEAMTADICQIELRKMEILPTPLGH